MLENLNQEDEWQIVTRMKKIVPEFVSKNSKFESIDVEIWTGHVAKLMHPNANNNPYLTDASATKTELIESAS